MAFVKLEFIILYIVYLIISLVFNSCHSYYLSPNKFTHNQASYYCKHYCQSNIASIHNVSQQQNAINTIKLRQSLLTQLQPNTMDIWIGLKYDSTKRDFIWTDNTTFDFGSYDHNDPLHSFMNDMKFRRFST